MNFNHKVRLYGLFGAVLIIAFLIRVIALYELSSSPLRYYYLIDGLDMKTLVMFGNLFIEGSSPFGLYRAFLGVVLALGLPVNWMIIFQYMLGIATVGLVFYIALHIWGRTLYAFFAAMTVALYAPLLMYESFVLRESFFFFLATLSFSAILWARRKHFAPRYAFFCAVALALVPLVRFSGILWTAFGAIWVLFYILRYEPREQRKRQLGFFVAGFFIIFFAVSLFNAIVTKGALLLPWAPNFDYIASVGAAKEITSLNVEVQPLGTLFGSWDSIFDFVGNMLYKVPMLFDTLELPNNLNYYFIRGKLPVMHYLVGPALIMPLGFAGLLVALINRRFCRREHLIYLFLIAFSLPLLFFYPLARYRLMLLLPFALLLPYPVYLVIFSFKCNCRKWMAVVIFILYCLVFYFTLPIPNMIYARDLVGYAKALELTPETWKEDPLYYYIGAYKKAPDNPSVALNLSTYLWRQGQFSGSFQALFPALDKHKEHLELNLLAAMSSLTLGKVDEGELYFARVKEHLGREQKFQFYALAGEVCLKQNRIGEAEKYWHMALNEATVKERAMIGELLRRMRAREVKE